MSEDLRLITPRVLFEVEPSAPLRLFEGDEKLGSNATLKWSEDGLTVRVVRGRKMRTVSGLFDEFAAALQFPYYFGENWAAFDECLSDMDWLPMGAGLVVAVLDPGEVLADAPKGELPVLARRIAAAAETYSNPIDLGEWWDRPPVPFHVVLCAPPEDVAAVRARWRAAGAKVPDLDG
jgi:hypothetical protein